MIVVLVSIWIVYVCICPISGLNIPIGQNITLYWSKCRPEEFVFFVLVKMTLCTTSCRMFRLPSVLSRSTVRSLSSYGKVDEKIVSLISGIVGPENVTTSESGTYYICDVRFSDSAGVSVWRTLYDYRNL